MSDPYGLQWREASLAADEPTHPDSECQWAPSAIYPGSEVCKREPVAHYRAAMTPPREPRRYPNGEPDLHDPAWHEEDGHGGCVICLFYVPHTEDEQVRQNWPCAVVREAEAAGAPLREALERIRDHRPYPGDEKGYRYARDIARAALAATPAPAALGVEALRLPWHRETIGHQSTAGIVASVAADLNVPLDEGLPPNTDATWIVNADNKVVAFVGNGPRQTHNADAIIAALAARAAATEPE